MPVLPTPDTLTRYGATIHGYRVERDYYNPLPDDALTIVLPDDTTWQGTVADFVEIADAQLVYNTETSVFEPIA